MLYLIISIRYIIVYHQVIGPFYVGKTQFETATIRFIGIVKPLSPGFDHLAIGLFVTYKLAPYFVIVIRVAVKT
ncbi:hypothetical protein D3C85_956470 [compost metagenome]